MFDVYRPSSLEAESRSKRGWGHGARRRVTSRFKGPSNWRNFLGGNHTISLEGVSPCSHEEADTQIFVHARHAAQEGSTSLLVKASDTDILVITISVMPNLQAIGLQKLWIAFGQGKHMR